MTQKKGTKKWNVDTQYKYFSVITAFVVKVFFISHT